MALETLSDGGLGRVEVPGELGSGAGDPVANRDQVEAELAGLAAGEPTASPDTEVLADTGRPSMFVEGRKMEPRNEYWRVVRHSMAGRIAFANRRISIQNSNAISDIIGPALNP